MGGGKSLLGVLSVMGGMLVSTASFADGPNGDGRPLPVIEIWKGQRVMELREDDQVVRKFEVALGYSPANHKRIRGDARTPTGRYHVSRKNPASQFHRFLGINYPNTEDAERGYREHAISVREWADLFIANLRYNMPSSSTALGGLVGIHGYGGRARSGDWTKGCIAVTDDEIDYIYDRVSVGTPVIINE